MAVGMVGRMYIQGWMGRGEESPLPGPAHGSTIGHIFLMASPNNKWRMYQAHI